MALNYRIAFVRQSCPLFPQGRSFPLLSSSITEGGAKIASAAIVAEYLAAAGAGTAPCIVATLGVEMPFTPLLLHNGHRSIA